MTPTGSRMLQQVEDPETQSQTEQEAFLPVFPPADWSRSLKCFSCNYLQFVLMRPERLH